MKALTFLAIFFAAVIGFSISSAMAADVNPDSAFTYFNGDRGTFVFPASKNGFSVMRPIALSEPEGFKREVIGGIINNQTIVGFINMSNLTKKDLFLINGKEVLVWGKFIDKGKGEAVKTYAVELNIVVFGINGW